MSIRPQDDLNQHDFQAMIDNAATVSREATLAGFMAYTFDELDHMSDEKVKETLANLLVIDQQQPVDERMFLAAITIELIPTLPPDEAKALLIDIWSHCEI